VRGVSKRQGVTWRSDRRSKNVHISMSPETLHKTLYSIKEGNTMARVGILERNVKSEMFLILFRRLYLILLRCSLSLTAVKR
jgi:hypothetical protein